MASLLSLAVSFAFNLEPEYLISTIMCMILNKTILTNNGMLSEERWIRVPWFLKASESTMFRPTQEGWPRLWRKWQMFQIFLKVTLVKLMAHNSTYPDHTPSVSLSLANPLGQKRTISYALTASSTNYKASSITQKWHTVVAISYNWISKDVWKMSVAAHVSLLTIWSVEKFL